MSDQLIEPVADDRRRRADGERSRAAILDAATKLATTEGLNGLSIGRLADHIGMSKSGLYAHFGSKEELQLAALDAAAEIFTAAVIAPTAKEEPGLPRLLATADTFAAYVEKPVFPGGCFFAAAEAEFAVHTDRVRTRLVEVMQSWTGWLERRVREAQERGEIDASEDPKQIAFELNAMLQAGNSAWLVHKDGGALDRARCGFRSRLQAAASPPSGSRIAP